MHALVNFENDEYVYRVARTPKQIQELIENGFDYICDQDDLKFFRRRK
jgi:NAD/NADP transhydrogenase alpha subunit